MKKVFLLLLVICMCATFLVSANVVRDVDVTVLIDGQLLISDQPALIYKDRTMVPIRAVCEKMGYGVEWDVNNAVAVITNDRYTVSVKVDYYIIERMDNESGEKEKITTDVPAMIVNDRILIPLRAVSEAFGADVEWDGKDNCAYVYTEGSGGSSFSTGNRGGYPVVTWFLRCQEPEGFKEVQVALNEYLEHNYGFSTKISCINPDDYAPKVSLALAAGEPVDLVWNGNRSELLYEQNVDRGAFMEIDQFFEMPEFDELKSYYREGIWDAVRVNGKIYGIPMEQAFFVQDGYWFNDSVSEKYGLSERVEKLYWLDSENHGTIEELEQIFDIVRAGEGSDFAVLPYGVVDTFNEACTEYGNLVISRDGTVDFQYERKLDVARRARLWNEKGYFPENTKNAESYEDRGKAYSGYVRYLPVAEAEFKRKNDYGATVIPTGEALITRAGVQSSVTSLYRSSKNPLEALRLIMAVHTDEYVFNLLSYGIDGRDFFKDIDNPRRMLRDNEDFYIPEYLVGSQFMAYLVPEYEDDVWYQTRYKNETERMDEYIGFYFDSIAVASEIAQVNAIESEYHDILRYGLDDPEIVFPEYYNKLKLAGIDAIIYETQGQLDYWRESES